MRLIFDIEANGFLKEVSKIHCIGTVDVDTGEQRSYGPKEIDDALDYLYEADEIIGHNSLDYDLKVLAKVKNWHPRPGCRRTDTLVISRVIHADLRRDDGKRVGFPKKLTGSHSLKAWGLRLGEPKDEYGYDADGNAIPGVWDNWTQEMQDYMDQDLRTTKRLLNHLKPWEYPAVPLALEHRVQEITLMMTEAGWPFDQETAVKLYTQLVARRGELEESLIETFGSWQEVDKVFIPKRDNKRLGYVKDVEVTKYKKVTFNPGSRVHIEKKLTEFGWKPTVFTPSGRAKVDEKELLKINLPEAKDLIEFLLIQKRLGQIGDGDNAWLKMVDAAGLIHGRYNTMGTNTGRAAHYSPNLGQVPKVSAPYGAVCRSCFTVKSGFKLVGADLSGAQLRCFAHMIAFYDHGKYAEVILSGDIHWYHGKIICGLPMDLEYDKHDPKSAATREKSKTTIYAFLFGAQEKKLGSIWYPAASVGFQKEQGRIIMKRLESNVQGLKKIREQISKALKSRKFLKGLDGRLIPIRSEHSALNAVIQNYEAVLCKTWLVNVYDRLIEAGFKWGWDGDFVMVGFIHDEIQTAIRDIGDNIERAAKIITQAAKDAGKPYGFRVRLDCDATVGMTWSDTH